MEIIELKPKYRPYDLASILESVMAIEAISSRMPNASSNCIELDLGMVKKLGEGKDARMVSSGRIAKSRRGENGLDPLTLRRLLKRDSRALPKCSPLIWELIRSGQLHMRDERERYNSFSEQVCKLLHVRTMIFGPQPIGVDSHRPVTLDHLRCLVAIGTLDAITALWMLLIQADAAGSDNTLVIASHIPPALATFYHRPEGRRTAVLLFALMRKLILDRVQMSGHELSLCRYDLLAVAEHAIFWTLPSMEVPYDAALRRKASGEHMLSREEKEKIERLVRASLRTNRAKSAIKASAVATSPLLDKVQTPYKSKSGLPEVPADMVEWIERARAPLRRIRRRSAKAAKWAYPARCPLELINQPHPGGVSWKAKAIAKFQEELGDYLC